MRNGEVVDRMSGADEAGLRAMVAELSASRLPQRESGCWLIV